MKSTSQVSSPTHLLDSVFAMSQTMMGKLRLSLYVGRMMLYRAVSSVPAIRAARSRRFGDQTGSANGTCC